MTVSTPLRFIRPVVPGPEEWVELLEPAYEAKQFTNFGPVTRRFEQALAQRFAGSRQVVTTANATAGLTAVLQALGIRGPVVVPSFTFPATAHAVLMAGCTPVFCDCSARTWGLDPAALARVLDQRRPAAVIHVRPFGFSHEVGDIEALTRNQAIPLIIDAAAALGAQVDVPSKVGLEGTAEVFSLHATKVFGVGEGGAVFVEPELESRLRRTTNFGLDGIEVSCAGGNAKLSEVQAAIGLSVLERLPDFVRHRRRVAARYHDALCQHPRIERCWPNALAPWQCFPLLLAHGEDAGPLVGRAAEAGVELRRYYYLPLHQTRAFNQYCDTRLPVTESLAPRILCLPVYADMSETEQDRVIDLMTTLLH